MSIVLRDLAGMPEFLAAEDLQRQIWGADDTADPADLMMVIQHEGGLVAGAFDGATLVGYIFGFPTRDPEVQHSHRLGVLPSVRGGGLSVQLKRYQRDWCLARGIRTVRWTFDPLRVTNAHLNIARLGAIVRTYHADYYGAMAGINAGLPSDRLLAEWLLESPQAAVLARGEHLVPPDDAARVAIPKDIDGCSQPRRTRPWQNGCGCAQRSRSFSAVVSLLRVSTVPRRPICSRAASCPCARRAGACVRDASPWPVPPCPDHAPRCAR